MSATATALTSTTAATELPAALREPAVPLTTLVRIELRKMADTRAGRWLLAVLGLILVAMTVVYGIAADHDERTFDDFFHVLQLPIAALLPVIGILSVTSEWSQRTALTTFTLVPDRWRVVLAKLLAVVALGAVAIAGAAVAAAVGNAFAGGDGSWAFGADDVGEVFYAQAAGMIMGLAFGLVIQASAPAIVSYFVLPTAWGILTAFIGGLEEPARWLDTGRAFEPLFEGGTSATEWARIGTSSALWILLPLVIGLVRLPRSEVK